MGKEKKKKKKRDVEKAEERGAAVVEQSVASLTKAVAKRRHSSNEVPAGEGAGGAADDACEIGDSLASSEASVIDDGYAAFSELCIAREVPADSALVIWNGLAVEQQKAFALCETFVEGMALLTTPRVPKRRRLDSSGEAAVAGGTGSALRKRHQASSFATAGKASSKSAGLPNVVADLRDEYADDDGDSIDDAVSLVTGLHLYVEEHKEREIKSDEELFESFVAEPLEERIKWWDRARQNNLEELRRLLGVAEKVKRLRAISTITRFEIADRAQHFWDGSAAALTAELAATKRNSKRRRILDTYKLKYAMGGLMADLWHVEVMERLAKKRAARTSSGLRRVLQEAFTNRNQVVMFPWGESFIAGEYPLFDVLRVHHARSILWPRLCHSPFEPKLSVVQKVIESSQRNVDSRSDEGAFGGGVSICGEVTSAVVVVEKEEGGREVGEETGGESEDVPPDGRRALPSEAEVASRAQKALRKRMAERPHQRERARAISTQMMVTVQSVDEKKALAQHQERQRLLETKEILEKREREEVKEGGTAANTFGTFVSESRLFEVFSEKFAMYSPDPVEENEVAGTAVQPPELEGDICYDVRALEAFEERQPGIHVYYEEFQDEFNVVAIEYTLAGRHDILSRLQVAAQTVVPLLQWQGSPSVLKCPLDAPACTLLLKQRNLRLGCWTCHKLCVHSQSSFGDDLVAQLQKCGKVVGLSTEVASEFIRLVLKLDRRLNKFVAASFPLLFRDMQCVVGQCRLRRGKSIFSTVTLVGDRGRHCQKARTAIGVRAIVNLQIGEEGARKLILQSFQPLDAENDDPVAIDLRSNNVMLIPAKMAFSYSRDDSLVISEAAKCLTLEFFCVSNLNLVNHGKKEAMTKGIIYTDGQDNTKEAGKTDEGGAEKTDGTSAHSVASSPRNATERFVIL